MNVALYFRKKSLLQQIEEFSSTLSMPLTTARPKVKEKEKLEENWKNWIAGAAVSASLLGQSFAPNGPKLSPGASSMKDVRGYKPLAGDYSPPRPKEKPAEAEFNWDAWNKEMEQVPLETPGHPPRLVWQPREAPVPSRSVASH